MKAQPHEAMNGESSGRGFFGRLATAGALAVVMVTGCAAAGDETPSTSAPPTNEPKVVEGSSDAPPPQHDPGREFSDALENASPMAQTVTPSTYGSGASSGAPPAFKTTANITCNPIKNGTNSVTVNGKTRKFEVQLPANLSVNAGILFEWHGFLQNAAEFQNTIVYDPPAGKWRAFNPNAFNIPLITIAPQDTNLIPVWGLDWDIVSGEKDFPFFEAMLTCVEAQFKVDTRRVYSFGFSAGAVFTNLLAAAYPKLFAATISESGVWFNDRNQWNEIIIPFTGTLFMKWKWPALNKADRGAVLLTHGGPNDFATVISLENANNKAVPWLVEQGGRDVTECTHEFGHTLEPDLTEAMIYQFMWDHELGGPRRTTLTAGMPTAQKPLYNSRCYFYPGW